MLLAAHISSLLSKYGLNELGANKDVDFGQFVECLQSIDKASIKQLSSCTDFELIYPILLLSLKLSWISLFDSFERSEYASLKNSQGTNDDVECEFALATRLATGHLDEALVLDLITYHCSHQSISLQVLFNVDVTLALFAY